MEPIPETLQAFDELDAVLDEESLLQQLRTTADRAREVAPGIVGVSVASREEGITFTLIATDDEIALLDAVQYVASGPCVDAMDLGHGIATSPEGLLSEARWHDFARASAAAGVRSTLTFPVIEDDRVRATVNLYGHAEDTFVGRHEALAATFGAWAPGAVANADLSFATRAAAEQAPELLKQSAQLETATGILAAQGNVPFAEARRQLDDAARRAGVPTTTLAAVVVQLHRDE
jgi:hypothetical protein